MKTLASDSSLWRFGTHLMRPHRHRVTESTRIGYQDELLRVERLLESAGSLSELSPIHRRRRTWEAWKRAHGLEFQKLSESAPYGLESQVIHSIESAEDIPRSAPHPHGDERAREASRLVDRLFEMQSAALRSRLLIQLGGTFDGIRTTSLRRQLMDVVGSHLIGLDHDPALAYTGRPLTQQERVAAARAIGLTLSPHSLYYLEKFTEEDGRSYEYASSTGVAHWRSTAAVREAVVYAVERMLDEIERNTFYASRDDTWKMQEYATDIGRLRNRLVQLNHHLYANPANGLRLHRWLPLPKDAQKEPPAIQRLWQRLTRLSDEQLIALKGVLEEFSSQHVATQRSYVPASAAARDASHEDFSYVERTRRIVGLVKNIGPDAWPRLGQKLAQSAILMPILAELPELTAERPLAQVIQQQFPPRASAGGHSVSTWGRTQEQALKEVKRHGDILLTSSNQSGATRAEYQLALSAIVRIFTEHRCVPNAFDAFAADLRRVQFGLPKDAAWAAVEQLRRRVQETGGPGMHYQIRSRPAKDPNRIVFETAMHILAAVAQGEGYGIDARIRSQANTCLAELGLAGAEPPMSNTPA